MESDQLETWRNVTAGRFVLTRHSALTNQRQYEMIGPGKTFHVTPTERRLNQELAADDELDSFLNGTLQPVRLLDGTEEGLLNNPNHIADDDVAGMFKLHHKTFGARLQQITNTAILNRMLEVAREDDVNATVRQVEAIQARIREVDPPMFETAEVTTSAVPVAGGPSDLRPVSPR